MKVAIGIATAGRQAQLQLTLQQVAKLDPLPQAIFVCPASADDYANDPPSEISTITHLVHGERGLCRQRNSIIAKCREFDVLTFLDDDFYPAVDYIARVDSIFEKFPEVVIATAHPESDGAAGPGISHDEALSTLARLEAEPQGDETIQSTYGGYGCNMSLRLQTVYDHAVYFDEDLPLYGWLEDIDFSRRLSRHGRVVKANTLQGVHLGTKRGRTPGRQLGYSQIVNPLYMWRKGSMDGSYAVRQISRNVAKNSFRALYPEPWVDRRGRLLGNLIGAMDVLRGIAHPNHALRHK